MDRQEINEHIDEWCRRSLKAVRQLEMFLGTPDYIISETYREKGETLLKRLKNVQGVLIEQQDDPDNTYMSEQDIDYAKNALVLVGRYIKIEMSIPFQDDFSAGQSINLFQFPYQSCRNAASHQLRTLTKEVNSTTVRFCIATSINDVSDTLNIHPIYVLQVEANAMKNMFVTSCLQSMKDPQNICLIFHLSHVKKTVYVEDAPLQSPNENEPRTDNGNATHADNSSSPNSNPRHLITSLDYGNELTAICNIKTAERERQSEVKKQLISCLESERGTLDAANFHQLQKKAPDLDKIFDNDKQNVKFEYHSYCEFEYMPCTFHELMKTFGEFIQESRKENHGSTPSSINRLDLVRGIEYGRGYLSRLGKWIRKPHDSLVYFKHSPTNQLSQQYNGVRATIQSVGQTGLQVTKKALQKRQQTFKDLIQELHDALIDYNYTESHVTGLKKFLDSDPRIAHLDEGTALAQEYANSRENLNQLIRRLDFADMPPEQERSDLKKSNIHEKIQKYMENVQLTLPVGPDMDLFVFGKTGHGKSATCNSIIGDGEFKSSDSTTSETRKCQVGYRRVDGRVIKVVDTPGVQDTRTGAEKLTYDMSKGDFNLAVASCPEGFHALLLFWKYAERMTSHDTNSLQMLKKIWGDDILKNHGVIIITYGDNFKAHSFEDWCKRQSGAMQKVFEACDYRCVLFDNDTDDEKKKKRQLCQLVACIDKLPNKGQRFQNKHFKAGLTECQELYMNKFNMEYENRKRLCLLSKSVKEALKDGSAYDETKLAQITDEITDLLISQTESSTCAELVTAFRNLRQSLKEAKQSKRIDEKAFKKFQEAFENSEKNVQEDVVEKTAAELKKVPEYSQSCFPSNSRVVVSPGTCKTMDALNVGDKVLVRNQLGQLVYDTIYMFGHRDSLSSSACLVLETSHQRLAVTNDHLIFCNRNGLELNVPAREIKKGDDLLILNNESVAFEQVLSITCETKKGLYAPFTKCGTLFVDDVLVSCYVDILEHKKAHKLLMPMRTLYQISPAILRFVNGNERGNDIPTWARFFLKLKMHE